MQKKVRFWNMMLFLTILLLVSITVFSCSFFDNNCYVTIINNSGYDLTDVELLSGYQNMSSEPVFEYTKKLGSPLNAGDTVNEIIDVPRNGAGDFEAVGIKIILAGKTYEDSDSYLYYNNQGGNDDVTITIADSIDDSISININTWK